MNCYGRNSALLRASDTATQFAMVDDTPDEDFANINRQLTFEKDEKYRQWRSNLIDSSNALPTPKDQGRHSEPNFLLTRDDLHQRDPKFVFENLSLHLLDMGYGPSALISFHKIDGEMDFRPKGEQDVNSWNAEKQSRSGNTPFDTSTISTALLN